MLRSGKSDMSVGVPQSQESMINDMNDDKPNVEVCETASGFPEPKIMSQDQKDEINQMSYKELEHKLEEDKKDRPPVAMPLSF